MFSIFLGICLGVKFLGRMVISCLTFLRNCQTFPNQLHHFTSLPTKNIYQDFSFPKFTTMSLSNTVILPILVVVKWYLTVVLISISKMTNSAKHLMCFLRHLYVFLWRMSIQILYPFLNWSFIKSF